MVSLSRNELRDTIKWHHKIQFSSKQGKSEGFDSCDRPSNLKLDSNRRFFSLCDREFRWMTSKNNSALLLYYVKLCASFQIHWWIQSGVTVQKLPLSSCRNWRYFILCDLEIWWMTLENNRTTFLYHIKLCASFQSHQWSQTLVTARKRSIRVKIGNFLSRVTLKFDKWPWKTIGHLSCAPSSLVHHFIAIGEFKLELQSGNVQFGSKSTIFFIRVTLKFDELHWKTIGHLFYTTLSFVHHFKVMS